MPCSSEMISQNLAPIWFPHCPAWMWTISLMVKVDQKTCVCCLDVCQRLERTAWQGSSERRMVPPPSPASPRSCRKLLTSCHTLKKFHIIIVTIKYLSWQICQQELANKGLNLTSNLANFQQLSSHCSISEPVVDVPQAVAWQAVQLAAAPWPAGPCFTGPDGTNRILLDFWDSNCPIYLPNPTISFYIDWIKLYDSCKVFMSDSMQFTRYWLGQCGIINRIEVRHKMFYSCNLCSSLIQSLAYIHCIAWSTLQLETLSLQSAELFET